MRNFYLTADIDGRQTMLTGGPRAKKGEMHIELRQRDEGRSVVAFTIKCTEFAGKLMTTVFDSDGYSIARFETDR